MSELIIFGLKVFACMITGMAIVGIPFFITWLLEKLDKDEN